MKKVEPIVATISAAPRDMVPPSGLSSEAKKMIASLKDCLTNKDHIEMSDLLFDIECDDDLADQIDVDWYQA
mgnify:CR=1 FL=1